MQDLISNSIFKLGTVLDRKCRAVLVLDIKLGSKIGTVLGSEFGTAKSKMNISIPTGN
jgi:hypothetical protein